MSKRSLVSDNIGYLEKRKKGNIEKVMTREESSSYLIGATCGKTIIENKEYYYTLNNISLSDDDYHNILREDILSDKDINNSFGSKSELGTYVYTYVLCNENNDTKLYYIKANSVEELGTKHTSIIKYIGNSELIMAGEIKFQKTSNKSKLFFNIASGSYMKDRNDEYNRKIYIDIFVGHILKYVSKENSELTFEWTKPVDTYISSDFNADISYLNKITKINNGSIQLFENKEDCMRYNKYIKSQNYNNKLIKGYTNQKKDAEERLNNTSNEQEKKSIGYKITNFDNIINRFIKQNNDMKKPDNMGITYNSNINIGGKKVSKGNKRTMTNKRRKTNKRGGMRIKFTRDMVNNFKNPHDPIEFPNDCCPCVFKFLGAHEDVVKYLQKARVCGFSVTDIEYVINHYYKEYNSTFVMSDDLLDNQTGKIIKEKFFEVMNNIFEQIPKGMAAIGGITRGELEHSRHCIAYVKDDDGNCLIIDAQKSTYYVGAEYIWSEWAIPNNIQHLFILNSARKGDSAQLMLPEYGNDINRIDVVDEDSENSKSKSKSKSKSRKSRNTPNTSDLIDLFEKMHINERTVGQKTKRDNNSSGEDSIVRKKTRKSKSSKSRKSKSRKTRNS